jgi:hypothetical protein
MQNIRLLLAALAVLALAACYPPTTSHPIGSTVGFKSDPSLLGLWKARSPDPDNHSFYYYHVLQAKDGAMFAVLVPSGGDGKASDVMMFKLKTARFGNLGFLNVRVMMDPEHEAPDQPPGWVPVLYRFEANGTLKIFILEEDATKNAIRTHKIAGTVGNAETDDAVVTADGATLDNFFRSRTGLALFDKPFVILTKVK